MFAEISLTWKLSAALEKTNIVFWECRTTILDFGESLLASILLHMPKSAGVCLSMGAVVDNQLVSSPRFFSIECFLLCGILESACKPFSSWSGWWVHTASGCVYLQIRVSSLWEICRPMCGNSFQSQEFDVWSIITNLFVSNLAGCLAMWNMWVKARSRFW